MNPQNQDALVNPQQDEPKEIPGAIHHRQTSKNNFAEEE